MAEMMSVRKTAVCPACHGQLRWATADVICLACERTYELRDDMPLFVCHDSPQAARQAAWFDHDVDETFEIERPNGAPRLYGWLLREKFRRSVSELGLRGATALTVCGGSGMDAEFLARAGARVISTDISLGAACRARERGRRHGFSLDVILADAERLPFPDRSIDVVYVHDGLHHLERPLDGLAEMARVARHAVCVTEPARAAATRLAVRLGLALDREDAGNRVARLGLEEVTEALSARGFRVVRAERYAMYYQHEPGLAAQLLSTPGVFAVVRGAFRLMNRLFGASGNKLVVMAVQP
jgi:SAM-dependent methyltransferase